MVKDILNRQQKERGVYKPILLRRVRETLNIPLHQFATHWCGISVKELIEIESRLAKASSDKDDNHIDITIKRGNVFDPETLSEKALETFGFYQILMAQEEYVEIPEFKGLKVQELMCYFNSRSPNRLKGAKDNPRIWYIHPTTRTDWTITIYLLKDICIEAYLSYFKGKERLRRDRLSLIKKEVLSKIYKNADGTFNFVTDMCAHVRLILGIKKEDWDYNPLNNKKINYKKW